ncbi:Uncharacterised protein [uncultured archaeon]|nr:Uncharacterised protein [uncultured archaeon]
MTNWRKTWAGLTRNWDTKVLYVFFALFAIFFLVLLQRFQFTTYDANQYLYNLVGGLTSGIITTVALTYFFKRQEERTTLSQNRSELVHLNNAWLEQSKDLLEKMRLDIRPAPDLQAFEEREANVREKVESLIADLAGNRALLQTNLQALSYVDYRDFVHRLSTIGHLEKQFGENTGAELHQILSDLAVACEKTDNRFGQHTTAWVSGTEMQDGQYRAVITGNKSEREQMTDLVKQSLPDLQAAFKALEKLKYKLDSLLLEI